MTEQVNARTKQALNKIAEELSKLWNEAQQENLGELAVKKGSRKNDK